jgi:hypothetical protein
MEQQQFLDQLARLHADMQRLVAVELNGAEQLLKAAAEAVDDLASILTLLLLDLSTSSPSSLQAIQSSQCKVVVTTATGTPIERSMGGVELVLFLHTNPAGTVLSRAHATAVLGQLAICTRSEEVEEELELTKTNLSADELKALYQDDPEFDPASLQPQSLVNCVEVPLRKALFEQGALDSMLEALFEISAVLVNEGCDVGTVAPRRTGRASRITEVCPGVLMTSIVSHDCHASCCCTGSILCVCTYVCLVAYVATRAAGRAPMRGLARPSADVV